MEVIWLVRGDAREGIDYDRSELTWLWQVTSAADKRIVEENQLGVNSRFYEPGPYAADGVQHAALYRVVSRRDRLIGALARRSFSLPSARIHRTITARIGARAGRHDRRKRT